MAPVRWVFRSAALLAFSLVCAAPATAKSYSADRFDVLVRVLPDGTLEVTETVVFEFERGTFREVFREIPLRRTDGIDVLHAAMDGRRLPSGGGPGTVEIRQRRNRVRVTWRFGPIEGATREFVLAYRVRGAVEQAETADRLAWRALPTTHAYPIRSSTIIFELPVSPSATPDIVSRRLEAPTVSVEPSRLVIGAADVRRNGWLEASLRFDRGAIVTAPPGWQQRAERIAAGSKAWMTGAIAVAGLGLVLLVRLRHGDPPPADVTRSRGASHQAFPPEVLEPAVAGLLVSNGRTALPHAIAALFSLADRGGLKVREVRGRFRQRDFSLTRTAGPDTRLPYERALLDTIFKGQARPGDAVTLSQARSRLTRKPGAFRDALGRALTNAGFLDADRIAARARYQRLAIWLAAAGSVGFLPAAYLAGEHGAWPLLLPAALLLVSLAATLVAESVTPLSNEGLRRAARWRAYRDHLRNVAKGTHPDAGLEPHAVLPLAVALGISAAWAKHLKRQGTPAPAWFLAAHPADAHATFPAFVAAGGSGASGGGGTGGGAAGGGASGAG